MAKKRKGNKDYSKPLKKKKTVNDQITIGEIFTRFPNLSEGIFGRLDVQSLASCQEVSKAWREYVDSQRIYYIRKIMKYANPLSKFHREWKIVLDKTPIKILKKFARCVWLDPQTESSPLYVAGALGDIKVIPLYQRKNRA